MAYQGYPFPYDLTHLLGGAVRVVWAPTTTAVPTKPSDIFTQVGSSTPPYSLKSGWNEFGAARDGFAYGRNLDIGEYTIQQVTGPVLEEVTNTTRTARLSVAEIDATTLDIIEEGNSFRDVTASGASAAEGVKSSAYQGIGFGTVPELTQYRIAFIARRHKGAGIVTEPTSVERGRFLIGVGYRAQLTADNVEIGLTRGELSAAQVTFRFFPDTDVALTTGNEFGIWWDETAGAIAA